MKLRTKVGSWLGSLGLKLVQTGHRMVGDSSRTRAAFQLDLASECITNAMNNLALALREQDVSEEVQKLISEARATIMSALISIEKLDSSRGGWDALVKCILAYGAAVRALEASSKKG